MYFKELAHVLMGADKSKFYRAGLQLKTQGKRRLQLKSEDHLEAQYLPLQLTSVLSPKDFS